MRNNQNRGWKLNGNLSNINIIKTAVGNEMEIFITLTKYNTYQWQWNNQRDWYAIYPNSLTKNFAQSAGAVEYTDCTSAEG